MSDHTKVSLDEVEDMAAKHGFGEQQEARFPREDIGLEASALGHMTVKPGQRQPFAHKHNEAEEVHVIIGGSGRVRLDDEIVDVRARDILRVGPSVTRAFEAGPEGLEYVVFSPRHEDDAEVVQDFWTEED
jgi:mannose-6-phosphate isomerase-like protein (cupin superfamily)